MTFEGCAHRQCHPITILEDPRFEETENFFVTMEKGNGVIPRMTFTDVDAEIIIKDTASMLWWQNDMLSVYMYQSIIDTLLEVLVYNNVPKKEVLFTPTQ